MKNTKKALLLSVMSLVLCLSMLVGTTFAWFTDSVSTARNTIASGNLDIVVSYKLDAKDNWAELNANTELFDDAALWEPGYTQVVYLKVANAGSLALKYQLGLNILSELSGTNVAGETFKLSDYIEFGVEEGVAEFATRELARQAVEADSDLISAGYSKANTLYPVGKIPADVVNGVSEEVIALVVYMPETVNNDANHLTGDGNQPSITLGLNVLATQVEAEFDSFGNDYDKDSQFGTDVATLAELEDALQMGGNINLTADIVAPDGLTISDDTVLNLNGHSLTATGEKVYLLTVDGDQDLTILNGKLVAESTNHITNGTGTSTGASSNVYFASTGKLTMKDVEVDGSDRGGHRAIQVYGGSAELTGVTIESNYGSGVLSASGAKVVLEDCDITVNGMYSQPYNSTCFSCFGGGEMTIKSGNYKLINDNTYSTGDTHGGWVGIIMNSGGTINIYDGTFTNVPAAGFVPAYERAIIEAENNYPAVSTLNVAGGTFVPQSSKCYVSYGDRYYPVLNGEFIDNGDGTWTGSMGNNVKDWAGVIYSTSDDDKAVTIVGMEGDITARGMIEGNATIESLTVKEGVTVLGNRTARKCYGLKTVSLPNGLVEIGPGAFQSCNNLETVNIPASVTTIGEGAFAECGKLTSITIPEGVTRLEKDALRATGLTEITLPASVTHIGQYAFRDCESLTKVYINAEEFTVETSAFSNMAAPFPNTTVYVKNAEMQAYLQGVFAANSSERHITVEIAP